MSQKEEKELNILYNTKREADKMSINPPMSQKESEWDENLKKSFLKELDFLSDHWVNGDDKPPFSFGGWREEVVNEFVKIAKTAVSNREKEIAEEVEKLKKDELFVKVEDDGTIDEHESHNQAINEVIKLLKH